MNPPEPSPYEETSQPLQIEVKSCSRLSLIRQWVASIIISMSYLIIGTCAGWPSPVLYKIEKTGEPFNMTVVDASLMVSLFYVGNIIMPIPCGILSDAIGRKSTLLLLTVIPLSSWILIYFAAHPAFLHIARLLAGVWGGSVRTVMPLYLGEIAEPRIRGALSVLATIQANAGILLAYVAGPLVSYWTLAVVCGVIPVLFFCLLCIVPESPYWLVSKSLQDKAAESLVWLRGLKDIEDAKEELALLKSAIEYDREQPKGCRMLFKSKSNQRAFLIVEVISITQRLSGIGAMVAFSSITLPDRKVGILSPNDCVMVIGIVRFLLVFAIIPLVDTCGRKPLLMISCAGCGSSMMAACIWFFIHKNAEDYALHWIPFASLLLYGCFFNVGIGTLATTIQSELFPTHLKALASAITAIVLAATSAIVNASYLTVAKNLGMYVNFMVFSLSCYGCFIFIWVVMFETKNKSLHEIQMRLQQPARVPARSI